MKAFVVDTNVAIVANGDKTPHADYLCQLTCVERLENLVKYGIIAIDTHGLILDEYSRHLRQSGKPGVGDTFFKFLFDRQYTDKRIWRVSIKQSENDKKGFEELPENMFDISDRKFLAVAVVADAIVLNATDSDWEEHASLMESLGVKVEQLCPHQSPTVVPIES